jgi:hypothetical protein
MAASAAMVTATKSIPSVSISHTRRRRQMFVLHENVGLCNAVRRTLSSDLKMWAPREVTFLKNTSCQTDEFIAHRIGLIPFKRVGNGDEMKLSACGPKTVLAGELVGPAFTVVHPEIEVMILGEHQHLDLTVHFDEQPASKHARYNPCAGVGMEPAEGGYRLTFETIDGRTPKNALLEALACLEARVDGALAKLAHQTEPPRSLC